MGLQDLDGKFPLGALVNDQGVAQPKVVEAYQRFLEALSQDLKEKDLPQADILDQASIPDLVDALVDWMDADDQGNFEEGAPNTRITLLDELYRIKGYGAGTDATGQPHLPIADAIIPYVDTRADGQINVNTAEPAVLASVHPELDYARAAEWYDELSDTPAKGTVGLQGYPSVQDLKPADLVFKLVGASERFRVRLSVDVHGIRQQAEAILYRDSKKKEVRTLSWREGFMRNYTFWKPRYQPTSFLDQLAQ